MIAYRKRQPYISLVNSYLIDSPQPSTLNYWYNLGSLLGLCLVIQIASGIFLAMHYSSHIELAFDSVEHIMRDVNLGWLIRYIHANGASFFFGCMYIHVGKALYYGSYRKPRVLVWIIGVIILIATMATGFMGYCLVYGQMSHWGATVITNLLSAIPFIGADIVPFIGIITLYNIYILYLIKDNNNNKWIKEGNIKEENIKEEINENKNNDLNFLSYFVGLVDGDGYIRISKKSKYVYISLIITLNSNDFEILNEIKEKLGMGNVNFITSKNKKYIRYEMNKKDLINKLMPLLENNKISFLTKTRQEQYLKVKYIVENKIVLYDDINFKLLLEYIENNIILEGFNKLWYFNNWLVGFTVAEGSFCVKKNKDIVFKLKQKYNFQLFEEILKYFGTTQNLSVNHKKYVEYSASNKKDIQLIINFFSYNDFIIKPNTNKYANIGLKGLKWKSYNKWLLSIKNSERYSKLLLP